MYSALSGTNCSGASASNSDSGRLYLADAPDATQRTLTLYVDVNVTIATVLRYQTVTPTNRNSSS